ncbi:glycosyltransferase [Blautia wexlerae]|uniref:glycosyltransferase n=1 Tax=Blautia wexlerae TaxID=418240 RepID=UPI0034A20B15
MRIVQINGGAKGSTGKIMMGIAEVARAQGHEVLCASPITSTNRDAGADCGYYRIGTYNSRRMNVALARITGYNGCFAWIETHKLLKEIDKFHPDIIHLHNLHDSYINLPMLFSYIKKHDIPVVWTLHDCWSFTGQCPYFTMVKCDEWKTGCHDCPQYKEYPSSLYDNTKMMWRLKKKWFTGVKNMTIVTPSKWLAGLVKESYLRDYPVQVINNGIDLNVFKPAEWGGGVTTNT